MTKLLTLLFLLFSSMAFGRAPAVEPIRGISIEEYREVDPIKDPGFNWNQDVNIESTALITTRTPAEMALINNTYNQTKSWPTMVFLFGLLTLPFFLWYSVMKSLDNKDHISDEGTADPIASHIPENTVSLQEERERRQKEDENSNLPKAS